MNFKQINSLIREFQTNQFIKTNDFINSLILSKLIR